MPRCYDNAWPMLMMDRVMDPSLTTGRVVQNYIFGVPTDHYVNRTLLALDWKVGSKGTAL